MSTNLSIRALGAALVLTVLLGLADVSAQGGPSIQFDYEFFPASGLADPAPGFQQDLGVTVSGFRVEASLRPSVFRQGKTVLVHTFSYRRLDLDYENWDAGIAGDPIENSQGIEYSLVFVQQLTETWNFTVVMTPGVHSDFQGGLSNDAFNLMSAVVIGRQYSERLSMGLGAVYAMKYGEGFPVPIFILNWSNHRNARIDLFLPMHAELWYLPARSLELGVTARLDGTQYHGDPSQFAVRNPQMRYTAATVGPSVKLRIGSAIQLRVDGGVTVMRRFEFLDGDDEHQSFDLKNSGFIRAGIQIGG